MSAEELDTSSPTPLLASRSFQGDTGMGYCPAHDERAEREGRARERRGLVNDAERRSPKQADES